ncbi:hypothetical protein [Erwinia oleae]|uniref:hypothetical protein n=1 Tax=Erwinia oleae TaxID=796334 RepID=UPI0005510E86|nr:hypothetical protein [Erwinia oleae]
MKELNIEQVQMVSGSGFIQNICANVGGAIGDGIYGLAVNVSGGLNFDLPLIGTINIYEFFPDIGKDLGNALGGSLGGIAENMIGGIPLIGGLLNKLMGN